MKPIKKQSSRLDISKICNYSPLLPKPLCCIQWRTTKTLMYKNIIRFFSFSLIPEIYVRIIVRASQRWLIHTHWNNGTGFLWKHTAFLLHYAWVKICPSEYNFSGAHAIHMVTRPAYVLLVSIILSTQEPT